MEGERWSEQRFYAIRPEGREYHYKVTQGKLKKKKISRYEILKYFKVSGNYYTILNMRKFDDFI